MRPQLDELLDSPQAVAEHKTDPVHGTEQITDHRKRAALDIGQEHGGPSGRKHPPLDGGGFQMGINGLRDTHELAGPLEIFDTLLQAAITHG